MSDIINLLPDAIANQIAAGEVIQRPASVVKELLENALDAKSTQIKLIVKDAGKGLIQVVDNGIGMSATDARMCFERHATSKIKKSADLFSLFTMGFRGEALASIAAIAQVELKTKRAEDEMGTHIIMEGSEIKSQEACQCATGTSFSIKNIFYNVPARRNFLKSNAVENRHIIEEFHRVALANPEIGFSFFNNDVEQMRLTPANSPRRRVVHIFGDNYNQRLIPIEEETDIVKIRGFVGKPKFVRKTRGEQYFFVNNRFIKSAYLNHAVVSAYGELLPKGTYPLYVIFIDIDPKRIDINVHPTKQEIKFEDERLVYTFIQVTIKRALSVHNITPQLDFDQEIGLQQYPTSRPTSTNSTTSSSSNKPNGTSFPKSEEAYSSGLTNFHQRPSKDKIDQNWPTLYQIAKNEPSETNTNSAFNPAIDTADNGDSINPPPPNSLTVQSGLNQKIFKEGEKKKTEPVQVHARYILSPIKSGFILIDQKAAHYRVLYEKYQQALASGEVASQKLLFPQNIQLPPSDAALLKDILSDINALGYDLQEFGANAFIIHGIPADLTPGNEQEVIEQLLEQCKQNTQTLQLDKRKELARLMAKNTAIKAGKILTVEEMKTLIDQLFACQTPYTAPNGGLTFVKYSLLDLEKQFAQKNT